MIAGGVVGGVVGGSVITAFLFWLYVKRKASQRVAPMLPQTNETEKQPSPPTVEHPTYPQAVSQLTRQEIYVSISFIRYCLNPDSNAVGS